MSSSGSKSGLPAMRTRDTFSGGQGRFTFEGATRELTKCANGSNIVSHEIVRDGIDALLQLKRASYSTTAGSDTYTDWTSGGQVLRTRPEPPYSSAAAASCFGELRWPECVTQDESGEEEEEEGEGDECSTSRSSSPVPEHRSRAVKSNPTRHHRDAPPIPPKPTKPPAVRAPTIWHHRKTTVKPRAVPDSPKSTDSVSRNSEDADSDDATAPAVLHFSCLQCHRAKKRCNRTRPCSRCLSRGMENDCRYPDKHDPRSVLRACLRCWQTKKKCDRKQPNCGKCDKVGVKCVYRRENQDSNETSPVQTFQVPTPTLTMSPPPAMSTSKPSRITSDTTARVSTPPPDVAVTKKRKSADDDKSDFHPKKRSASSVVHDANHHYSTRRRNSTSAVKSDVPTMSAATDVPAEGIKRVLRSRK